MGFRSIVSNLPDGESAAHLTSQQEAQLAAEAGLSFRHIPVIDEAGHPVGLLAAHDALDMDGLQMEQDLVRREEITVIL